VRKQKSEETCNFDSLLSSRGGQEDGRCKGKKKKFLKKKRGTGFFTFKMFIPITDYGKVI